MSHAPGWVSAQKAQELLGIDRKTLFKYRDDGTLTLGTHFAAFPGCMSRDGYRWNVEATRKKLAKIKRWEAEMAAEVC
jgi:hypothetical protein